MNKEKIVTKLGRLAAVLLLGMPWPSYAQVTKKDPPKQTPATASPSLQETTDFIVRKLDGLTSGTVGHITINGHDFLETDFRDVRNPKAADCKLTFDIREVFHSVCNGPCAFQGIVRWRVSLLLSELSPRVSVGLRFTADKKFDQNAYVLALEATRDQQIILEMFDDAGMFDNGSWNNAFSRFDQLRLEKSEPRPSKDVDIVFQDRELADRVAKAFEHAIELCGGKKEPF
jgi:hypothetical protein